jgi:hydroxyacylglutathione hydrolase
LKKINDILMIEGFGSDSNIYIFDDVIVDTGTGDNIEYVLNSLKKADLSPSDISLIVNTHCHFDHVGGNRYFDSKLAVHEKDAPALETGDPIATVSYMFGRSVEPRKVDFKLTEGDKIHDFEVIHTPGHTIGGICLYDGETLISGDTVFAEGGFGRYDIGGDLNMLKESIERLSKLDVEYLLPGHGPAADNGSEHIKLSNRIIKGF